MESGWILTFLVEGKDGSDGKDLYQRLQRDPLKVHNTELDGLAHRKIGRYVPPPTSLAVPSEQDIPLSHMDSVSYHAQLGVF